MLYSNALTGLVLVLSLLFFLNVRTALWFAAGIPTALCAAMALVYAGITINMISLFALLITHGIVVDDAIVVGDTDHRARMGRSDFQLKRLARGLPVLAATATAIIAFLVWLPLEGVWDLIADIHYCVGCFGSIFVECFLILPIMAHSET